MKKLFRLIGYQINKIQTLRPLIDVNIPDNELYQPLFSPWLGKSQFSDFYEYSSLKTAVSQDRCYVLYTLFHQTIFLEGNIWECGVYKGGTAAMFVKIIISNNSNKKLWLFDSFEGMPETNNTKDWHKKGDFSDTDINLVKKFVGNEDICIYNKGYIPNTFNGLDTEKICFAHIDVDLYDTIRQCLEFIWPRLSIGGFIVIDDYGFSTCPGARSAVDSFFKDKRNTPLCLKTGQAIIFKNTDG